MIVWLGKENATTAVGLHLLADLCQAFPPSNGQDIRSLWLADTSLIDLYEMEKSRTLQKQGIPKNVTSIEWQAAAHILDSTWFTRRWLLQEVTNLGRRIFRIGNHEITPEVLLGGIYRIASFFEFRYALNIVQREHCNSVEKIVQLMEAKQTEWFQECMADILLDTTLFQSSGPRDRIFTHHRMSQKLSGRDN